MVKLFRNFQVKENVAVKKLKNMRMSKNVFNSKSESHTL